ncbi:hypothetical protein HPB50_004426 [Hyalomma asiaticum]|uniref:Uncharacterized protein n=1 Tax=Hyalomma asiaticum TaxID=266040 RepID=A0ACB7TIH6_HYAAI|nr:hypothetical protein HPB50_004426 [Hyalomma asiaticum]
MRQRRRGAVGDVPRAALFANAALVTRRTCRAPEGEPRRLNEHAVAHGPEPSHSRLDCFRLINIARERNPRPQCATFCELRLYNLPALISRLAERQDALSPRLSDVPATEEETLSTRRRFSVAYRPATGCADARRNNCTGGRTRPTEVIAGPQLKPLTKGGCLTTWQAAAAAGAPEGARRVKSRRAGAKAIGSARGEGLQYAVLHGSLLTRRLADPLSTRSLTSGSASSDPGPSRALDTSSK